MTRPSRLNVEWGRLLPVRPRLLFINEFPMPWELSIMSERVYHEVNSRGDRVTDPYPDCAFHSQLVP